MGPKHRNNKHKNGKKRPLNNSNGNGYKFRDDKGSKIPNDRTRPSRNVSRGPTPEALELSTRLKVLSQHKELREALNLYESSSDIRDSHHACIVLDCCARCGAVEQADAIVKALPLSDVSVQVRTALMKGYAHAGRMEQAEALFRKMCEEKSKQNKPNVRTLNTLLRGCLWTATTVAFDRNNDASIHGGVVTSERAWKWYGDGDRDSSSFEYTISLLCQSMQFEAAESRLAEKAERLPDDLEALAASQTSLARAYAVAGNLHKSRKSCEESMKLISRALDYARSNGSEGSQIEENSRKKLKRHPSGGKRAWKAQKGNDPNSAENGVSDRARSNITFRKHRLNELRQEISEILAFCDREISFSPRNLARRLLTRLLYFSGGGTTAVQNEKNDTSVPAASDANKLRQCLVNSAFHSFGLKSVLSSIDRTWPSAGMEVLRRRDCNRIMDALGLQGGFVNREDGRIDFLKIFSFELSCGSDVSDKKSSFQRRKKTLASRPIVVELGAGFGEWAVQQAQQYAGASFVAVELRADRVSQISSRAAVAGLDNLCAVGADGGEFLSQFVEPEAVSTVVVNHPEPPTQVFGNESTDLDAIASGDRGELGHMLHSHALLAIARSLKASSSSRFIVVTDNRWYGRLICATLSKVSRLLGGDRLWRSEPAVGEHSKLSLSETFRQGGKLVHSIHLLEGRPEDAMVHMEQFRNTDSPNGKDEGGGSSGRTYFDRLWKTGVGQHAQANTRYIIIMSRLEG